MTRRGFSLFEVLLSLALMVGSMATIGHLISLGLKATESARDGSRAQMLCEGIMDEISAGIIPAQATTGSIPLELLSPDEQFMNANWQYTIELQTAPAAGMTLLHVTVSQGRAVREGGDPSRYTLSRWIIDPAIAQEMADAAAEAASGAGSSGSATGPSSSGSSGSGGASAMGGSP